MKYQRPTLATLFLFFVTTAVLSQTPSPTPEDDGDVVKISTNIIQLDVTVRDKKGRPITDLRQDEIEIFENGKKQDVNGFSFVSNVKETQAPSTVVPGLPPPPLRPERVRRTIAIVVDDLTLSFESTFFVRRAIKKFIETQMRDGDAIAIIRTGSGVGALQQFTNDKRQLMLAIDRIKFSMSGRIGAFEQIRTGEVNRDLRTGEIDERQAEINRDDDLNELRRNVFSAGTLGAVGYVIRGMSELPGRKSVMLVSEGFALFDRTRTGGIETNNTLDRLRVLVDQANRASVVVHTMDPRGLPITGITAADSVGEMSEEERSEVEGSRRELLADTQDGLRLLARQTGGTAVVNNNDLVGSLRRVLDDQSYYLVSYEPEEATFNAKTRRFNTIRINVTRPGARVRYRSGFYGISDERLERDTRTAGERLASALVSPFAVNDIELRLNALFLNSQRDGSALRSLVHIPISGLTFTDQPDGRKQAIFDIYAIAFGDNGQPVAQEAKTHTVQLSKESYEKSRDRGMVYDFVVAIKKPGGYQLRVALRDHGGDKIGSANQFVEIPNLKKKRLTASDILLEVLAPETVDARRRGIDSPNSMSKVLIDTALRRFRTDATLNFGMAIYNAKFSPAQPPNLTVQARLFKDGTLIFEGKPQPVPPKGQIDPTSISYGSSVALGRSTVPGDYVLQLTIVDGNNDDKKKNTISRFVQFELVN